MFASAKVVRCSMWRYAIVNRFDYKFVRNFQQQIIVK